MLGGLTARSNDILSFNGSGFQVWLNGNASGLSGAVLRDFEILNPNEVLLAFNAAVTLEIMLHDRESSGADDAAEKLSPSVTGMPPNVVGSSPATTSMRASFS